MKTLKNFIVYSIIFAVITLCPLANANSKEIISNVSPGECTAAYQYWTEDTAKLFGNIAAIDYAGLNVKYVWKDKENPIEDNGKKYFYYVNIHERSEKDDSRLNYFFLLGGTDAAQKGIYLALVHCGKGVPNRNAVMSIEVMNLAKALQIKIQDDKQFTRVIEEPGFSCEVYSTTLGDTKLGKPITMYHHRETDDIIFTRN